MRAMLRLLTLVTLLLATTGASADTRGLQLVLVKDKANQTVTLYKESHALVVGISRYTNGWPPLRGVRDDVPAVKAALEKHGFSVSVAMDLDRDGLDKTFRDFIARHGHKPDARLLFYFAGHGHSMKLGYGGQMGYLVGTNAPNPNTDKVGFTQAALSMQVVETYARTIESKHALFVFDSCFAGSVFDATRAIPDNIQEKTGKAVRQFITSGTADQTVPDKSIFRDQFVAALDGEGDLDGDGYVTGAELGQFLEAKVTNYTRRAQTPQYGKLRDPLLDKGDFVFVLARGTASAVPAAKGTDVVVWNAIKDSGDPKDFQTFLDTYSASALAPFARNRLAALAPKGASGSTPEMIRKAQRRLADLGYDPGPADGTMGTRTQGAIESFQRSNGLGVDGTVTDALLAGLDVARKQLAAVRPAPRPTPAPSQAKPAVGVYPKRYKTGDTFKDCANCPEMVVIPAGSFRMGDLNGGGDSDEKPVHTVTIPRPFAVGRYEVTRGEFGAFVNETGYNAGSGCYSYTGSKWGKSASKSWRSPGFSQTDRDPVVCMNWDDAKAYAGWLSRKAGKDYRLPSAAEWEYMARAGGTAKYGFGDAESSLCAYGNAADRDSSFSWKNKTCSDGYGQRTAPAGSFKPNGFGIYDTIGNVWEWVEDCWHGSYSGAPTNGGAWTTGGECGQRVLRGGSWYGKPRVVRPANRGGDSSDGRGVSYGFRVARTLSR